MFDIKYDKDRMINDIKELYRWSLEGDFRYDVDSEGKIIKL